MNVESIAEQIIDGKSISRKDASELIGAQTDPYDLMHQADKIRRQFKGVTVEFCSIINAKSGRCPNDCSFCAQSSHWCSEIEEYPLVPSDELVRRAESLNSEAVRGIGIVTSGVGIDSEGEMDVICRSIHEIGHSQHTRVCASLGELTRQKAQRLKEAGLNRYHHNLETSKRHYPSLCSTYDYKKKIETVKIAKETGLEICCGGIFGAGESWEDRLELAFLLRELNPDSVPLNFLRPAGGTPLEKAAPLKPVEALQIIALFRFILPNKTIKVCGGREYVLGDMQSWMFYAGADGAMLGNYLTTAGRCPDDDLTTVKNLGLRCR